MPAAGPVRWVTGIAARSGLDGLLRVVGDRYALREAGRLPVLRTRPARPFLLLIYHRVHPQPGPFVLDTLPPDLFDRQMAHLSRAYRVLSLEEILERSRNGSLPNRAAAVTFDDGYADNFEHAYPVLRRHGIPAAIFLVSDCIGTGRILWHDRALRCFARTRQRTWRAPWNGEEQDLGVISDRRRVALRMLAHLKTLQETERLRAIDRLAADLEAPEPAGGEAVMLDWPQVRAMRDGGISFGSHTETHPILSRMDPGRAWLEISRSRQAIEKNLDGEVTLFAYPNGRPEDYTEGTVEMVRRAGYRAAVTTSFGVNDGTDDPLLWRRVTPWETEEARFRLKLAYYRLRDPGPAPRPGGGA